MKVSLHNLRHLVIVALSAPLLACGRGDAPSSKTPDWLIKRGDAERAAAAKSAVIHDFSFTDGRASSGITFVNHIVDDAGKNYKAVHYDHGTGVCAADIDGDDLPDLYFVSQLGSSELWRNTGGGRFTNATAAAGLVTTDVVAVGCAFADIDNDSKPDLFISTVRHGNRLFHNEGSGTFRDISAESGVGYVGHSSGAVFFDYDNDGLLDLFVANIGVYTSDDRGPGGYHLGLRDAFHGHTHPDRAEASVLYHNLGGNKFAEVTQEMQLVDFSWSGDATVVDVNNDRFPDLYLLSMQGQNHLWINEGGKRFRDATSRYFPRTSWGAMGAKVFDYNGDGRLDLYVTDMHSDMFVDVGTINEAGERKKSDVSRMPPDIFPTGHSTTIAGNSFFENEGARGDGSVYAEVSDSVGVENYWPWGPSVGDLNADGYDDIFVTAGMNFPFRYAPNGLLLNDAGRRFVPAAFTLDVEPRDKGATEQKWFDLDCAGADRGHLYCSECARPDARAKGCRDLGAQKYTVMGALGSRSSVILDVDGDGDLDIVTNEFNAMPQVLVSNLSTKHRANVIRVRLRGKRSNRGGIGARVTVVLPDQRRLLKAMDGKSGYLSMSDLPLYFGLGASDHATSIEVEWPSGARQTVAGPVQPGKTVEVIEP